MASVDELIGSLQFLVASLQTWNQLHFQQELTAEQQAAVDQAYAASQAASTQLAEPSTDQPVEEFTPVVEQGVPIEEPPADEPPEAPPA